MICLQAIIDFFTSVGSIISTVINFVIKLFSDLIMMLQLLAKFIVNIPSYFGWLSSSVVAVIVTIFTIVVIYKILGREG